MSTGEETLPQHLLKRYRLVRNVWLAPSVYERIGEVAREALEGAARVIFVDPLAQDAPPGPAVIVLGPEDLGGPHREVLLSLLDAAQPGRPVLYGGSGSKDVLLDAINTWHVSHVVPRSAPVEMLTDAVLKAHEILQTAVALERASGDLRRENRRLAETLDTLRTTQDQLLHAQRLSTLGRISAGLIHSVREHLGALERFERNVRPHATDPDLVDLLDYAFDGVHAILVLLDEIRSFAESREHEYTFALESLDDLVGRAISFSRYDPLARSRDIDLDLKAGLRILVDRHRLYHVLLNLVRNAVQATEPRDRIVVRTRTEGPWALVEVEDSGCGMTEEIRSRIFEPFFTTKGERGMGLGLRMVQQSVLRHGGTIECSSQVGRGTSFRIMLPIRRGEPEP